MSTLINQKPVATTLLSMAMPTAIGMLSTFLFQLVDTYFIAQLGTQALSAVGFVYPVYLVLISLLLGFSAAVSSLVGNALGKLNRKLANTVVLVSLYTIAAICWLLAVIGLPTLSPLFLLIGAQPETLPMLSTYMSPLYMGLFLLGIGLAANAALMAKGAVISATVVMAIGGAVNAIFDFLLIFGVGPFPQLGLAGAAYATVISWFVIACLMLWLLYRHGLLKLNLSHLRKTYWPTLQTLIRNALPISIAQLLVPLGVTVITAVVAAYGEQATASLGIVFRIESLLLTGVMALGVVLTPVVGQSYGAKLHHRLAEIISLSIRLALYWGLLCMAVCWTLAEPMMALFTDDKEIITSGSQYLQTLSLAMPAIGLVLVFSAIFSGVKQPLTGLRLTFLRVVILSIPLSLLAAQVALSAIWISLMTANIIAAMYGKYLLDKWCFENDLDALTHSFWLEYQSDIKLFARN